MILLRFIGLCITLLIGLAIYLFFYLGVSKPVIITTEVRGPFYFLYKTHLGAYHGIGPIITEVEKWAHEQNLECPKTFGEFLDDPNSVDQDRLRSHAGCLLTKPLSIPIPPDFAFEERKKGSFAVGRFEGSPAIGPFKAYPKIREYIQTQRLKSNGAVVETYLIQGQKVTTEFLFPVEVPR